MDRKERREPEKSSKADRRREAAPRRAAYEPMAKEIKATEALMERIRKRIELIEAELADPALKERSDLAASLSMYEDKWLTLSAEYEEATAE